MYIMYAMFVSQPSIPALDFPDNVLNGPPELTAENIVSVFVLLMTLKKHSPTPPYIEHFTDI